MTLRIGRIEYANCTPIFETLHQLFDGECDYRYMGGVPSRLNRMLAAAEIDICPSSSFEYAAHPDLHLIVPGLSISSCGPVASVLLFSTLPIEKLGGREILLSSESATSVNLLRILLKFRFGLDCTFRTTGLDLENAIREAPAVLLIGDPALRAARKAKSLDIYDLGDLWYRWTGTPFVFALWLVSKQSYLSKREKLEEFVRNVWRARDHALDHLEEISRDCPDAEWMGSDVLLDYWRNNISYELSEQHIEGLRKFYHLSAELGLIAAAPQLTFMEI